MPRRSGALRAGAATTGSATTSSRCLPTDTRIVDGATVGADADARADLGLRHRHGARRQSRHRLLEESEAHDGFAVDDVAAVVLGGTTAVVVAAPFVAVVAPVTAPATVVGVGVTVPLSEAPSVGS